MRSSLRSNLLAIVGTAAAAILVLIISSLVIAQRADEQLSNVRERFLPKLEVGPLLEKQFEHLRRDIEDDVAARDAEVLAATRKDLDDFVAQLLGSPRAVDPSVAAALRAALEANNGLATDVARRQIAGESRESLLASMAAMPA